MTIEFRDLRITFAESITDFHTKIDRFGDLYFLDANGFALLKIRLNGSFDVIQSVQSVEHKKANRETL